MRALMCKPHMLLLLLVCVVVSQRVERGRQGRVTTQRAREIQAWMFVKAERRVLLACMSVGPCVGPAYTA